MPVRLNTADLEFDAEFRELLDQKREAEAAVDDAVAAIIEEVRKRGDDALVELTERFDGVTLTAAGLRFDQDQIDELAEQAPPEQIDALRLAAERIEAYHRRQLPEDARWTDEIGMELGWRWSPVDAAGLYAPGGLASYPSSVLMNAVPARAAGVGRLTLCAPTPKGAISPLVMAAARLAGVTEVYRLGGAQAIAAMAYGTESIKPVDVIVGPGNAYVAAAKRQVFGRVGIDSIAGPSEVLVIADGDNDPDWIALDLLAQAEHDASAQSILVTDSVEMAEAVEAAVARRLQSLARAEIAGESWRRHGAVIVVRELSEAVELSNRLAPEHLEILTADADRLSEGVRHAGAIFLGRYTPEAIGDYVGGPNHVLPTARAARHASGLSVLDFMKRSTVSRASAAALNAIGPAAATLADAEGLEAHALSVRARLAPVQEGGAHD